MRYVRLSEEQLSTGLRALDDALLSTEPFFDELSRPDPYLSNAGMNGTLRHALTDSSLYLKNAANRNSLIL